MDENGGFTLKTRQMFFVHTRPKKFENGDFTRKTRQVSFVHTGADPAEVNSEALLSFFSYPLTGLLFYYIITKIHPPFQNPGSLRWRNLKRREVTGHFGFVFEENSVREITWLSWRHWFRKALFSKWLLSTRRRKTGVFKLLRSDLKRSESVLKKPRFRDRLAEVWPNLRDKSSSSGKHFWRIEKVAVIITIVIVTITMAMAMTMTMAITMITITIIITLLNFHIY